MTTRLAAVEYLNREGSAAWRRMYTDTVAAKLRGGTGQDAYMIERYISRAIAKLNVEKKRKADLWNICRKRAHHFAP